MFSVCDLAGDVNYLYAQHYEPESVHDTCYVCPKYLGCFVLLCLHELEKRTFVISPYRTNHRVNLH